MGKAVIYFDTDNVPAALVKYVISTVSSEHAIDSVFAFGVFNNKNLLEKWCTELGLHAKAFFVHQVAKPSKNATDLAISFDVGKTMRRPSISHVFIVSNDRDYTVVLDSVNADGKKGIRLSLVDFEVHLEEDNRLNNAATAEKKRLKQLKLAKKRSKNCKKLQSDILTAMASLKSKEGGWYQLTSIGQELANNPKLKKVAKLKQKATSLGCFDVKDHSIRLSINFVKELNQATACR